MKWKSALLFGALLITQVTFAGLDNEKVDSEGKKGSVAWLKNHESEVLGERVTVDIHGWNGNLPVGVELEDDSDIAFFRSTVYVRDEESGEIFVRYDKKEETELKKKYTRKKRDEPSPERIAGILKKLPDGNYCLDMSKKAREKDGIGGPQKHEEKPKDDSEKEVESKGDREEKMKDRKKQREEARKQRREGRLGEEEVEKKD